MLFPFFVFLLDNKRRAWGIFCISLIINFLCQEYFFTEIFVDFNPSRHNILYSAPFLLSGGLCFLYRERLHEWSAKWGNALLVVCLIANGLYFVCPQSEWTLHQVIPLMVVFTLWLIYAMGAEHKWLHNRIMDFISGISMEFYLCHMVMFRVVEKVHLEKMVHNESLLFLLTCMAGIGLAVAFSYLGKKVIVRYSRF
jgi:peptidoglycan/LPS O-acetylase OafA/YrhL